MGVESSNVGVLEDTVQGWQDGIEAESRAFKLDHMPSEDGRKPSKQEFRQTVMVVELECLYSD